MKGRNKHLDNFYKHSPWHQKGELAAVIFWPKHEQSKEKHAGYEGQACPESRWEEEEGKSFLASYQILQQMNSQFGWMRKLGQGTNVVEIVWLSPDERKRVPDWGPPSWRKECKPSQHSILSVAGGPDPLLTKTLKANLAPTLRDPGARCGRALIVLRDHWELEVCLKISHGDRSFSRGI